MMRMGIPVATPIFFGELIRAVCSVCTSGDCIQTFCDRLRSRFETRHCFLTSSGRAALYLVLRALKESSCRNEVIIPSYICPSVARSVLKAGLKIVPADLSTEGFGLDCESVGRMLSKDTLAVVIAHLFGYPAPGLTQIISVSKNAGAMIIEDAAQAAGAEVCGRSVGTLGDAGIFSLGMSKVLSTMGGGIAVTGDEELAEAVKRFTMIMHPSRRQGLITILGRMAVYSLVTRSRHLGPLIRIWEQCYRGKSDQADFEVRSYSSLQAAVGTLLLKRMDVINKERCENAGMLERSLSDVEGISLPQANGGRPICLRYPVIVHDLHTRNRLLSLLKRGGINVSELDARESYESILRVSARRSRYPTTEYIVDRMIVLPTHFAVGREGIQLMADIFQRTCGQRRTGLNVVREML